ncbi:MAG: outer membrane beta-barrel protein [Fimbriimonadaceae bacterium]|nr:outer membrane beta-barrel protein [Fimbriimonadaceae bacterium]
MRRVLVACIALSSAPAFAQYDQIGLGPSAGIYMPSSSTLRDALGDSWISFGIGVTNGAQIKRKMGMDWNFVSQNSRGNRVLIITPSFGIMMPFQQQQVMGPVGAQFYGAARAGVSYIDYGITRPGSLVRDSARRFTLDGNVELGAGLGQMWKAYIRYDLMQKVDDFDFSGLSLGVSYSLFKF